ncbi:hypothetical protein J1614_006018 [Plenodomus biglobosus]|nr:hypothetical protein J1614_006018 [Plenodomus biglobosus]
MPPLLSTYRLATLSQRSRDSSSEYPRQSSSTSRNTDPAIEPTGSVEETTELNVGEESQEVSNDETFPSHQPPGTRTVASRRWTPGITANLPWTFILVLVSTVVWLGGCIWVIFAADKTKIGSWATAPTVILAILGPPGSTMLQYALSYGLVITWWNSALGGTTLGALHRQWDHGNSIWAASTSGRYVDKIALAKIIVLSVFAVNPLLQRALTTSLSTEREEIQLSTTAATDVRSLQDMNFTDAYRDGFFDPVQLSPGMTKIIQQFTEREPISSGISGCAGNCSGTLIAAGIDAQCNTIHNTTFTANYGQGAGGATLVFNTGTNIMNYHTDSDFNLTVSYADITIDEDEDSVYDEMKSCRGTSTAVTCVLQHAVIAYPFTQSDGIITPETQASRVRILSTEPALRSGQTSPDSEPIFGGLSIAADSIFNSSGTVQTMGKYGWAFRTSGPLTAPYLAHGGDVRTCAVTFNDPTENIITKLTEIMFRVALAAPNSSRPRTEFAAQQQTVSIIYESRYVYLWVAMAVTVLAMMAVMWTATGFHTLGRPASLSPLEIVNAFGAQLLRKPGTSNMDIEELMYVHRDTRIQYMSIDGGAEDTVRDMGNRLQIVQPGYGRRPRAQELFAG